MKRKVDFDWYCKTKKDVINNAAYELIVALTAKSAPPRKFELSIPQWDDLMIANIVENAMASSHPPASAMAVMSATRTRVRMARSTSHSSFSLMSNCFLARECFGTPLAVSRRC